jgi:hypothetical protein
MAPTRFTTQVGELTAMVDWPLMTETYWKNTPEDSDRVRRRSAEFLVHRELPVTALLGYAVRTQERAAQRRTCSLDMARSRAIELSDPSGTHELRSEVESMIVEGTGNLLAADVQALVNTVNTVGVMGKGIALQFKRAFPANYAVYRAACERGEIRLGSMLVHDRAVSGRHRYIINFPTKGHWRAPSRLPDVDAGLTDLAASSASWASPRSPCPPSAAATAACSGATSGHASSRRSPTSPTCGWWCSRRTGRQTPPACRRQPPGQR